ncbi:MAG: penicillin-binding transpeptidase domain-containing protein [Bdellovibrionaceae bacterium]|nr:penicillin-binding transpeptidase domain-containing protein [Pseudobdellovibrionaceae bacterium]
MRTRIIILFVGFAFLWIVILLRAAALQILPNDKLSALEAKQYRTVVNLEGRRGAILDRAGRELAVSTQVQSLYADPSIIKNKRDVARKLARILGHSSETLYAKIKDNKKRFVWIERKLSSPAVEKIKELGVRGLSFVEEWKRVYPNDELLGQTLGFVGGEGQGLEGLELSMDSRLRGSRQKLQVSRDARGRPLISEGLLFRENPDGHDIQLTIDSDIQYYLEQELQETVRRFEADLALGVVLDARTFEVRAMGTYPGLNPNQALELNADQRRNRLMTDTYEPGSVIKPFVVAAALKEKILQPNSKFFCEHGMFKVADRLIREADPKKSWGWLTVSEILAVSSNIGSAKIAFGLGSEKLRQHLLNFGFGKKTGIDLPGEARGTVHELPWNSHLLANVSFGHGMAATPIQVAAAYAALVNGGILRKPKIVDSWIDAATGKRDSIPLDLGRRVLSSDESASMRMILSAVTNEGGTGVNAKVPGFIVGGKTGTAQKVNPNGRGYLVGVYISSFAGFIPAHDPRFVVYIAVDHPKKAYYGSQVAAPVFSRVASYIARKEGLAPIVLTETDVVPKVKGPRFERPVAERRPLSEAIRVPASLSQVPDLRGMTVREALRSIHGSSVRLSFVGQGLIQDTVPAPGEPIPESGRVTVYLE